MKPFTKRELARLRQALNLAIEYQESSLDAHRDPYSRGGNKPLQDYTKQVGVWKRDIAAFERLKAKLREIARGEKE